ncbi:unnamed protein product [Caenorhabditis auriculariae]|uniref:SSD domain-containing protein n=1 Tax=Caenorhabditis auriculariae TaxID=2777116 RepID=A0A8S1GMV6_9PELO|nr:unnamed protein product [Caenorhabditis auriculariae]
MTHWYWAPLEKPWSNLLAKYCIFVARHPWPFILLPTFLTIFLSTGILLNFKIVRGVNYLYSPLDAKWKSEEAVLGENWANDDKHFYPGKDLMRRRGLYIIVKSSDGGDVLRREQALEFKEIMHWIEKSNMTSTTGEWFSYKDICLHFQNDCFSNTHAKLLADIFANGHVKNFNVTFPSYRSRFTTEPIDVLGNVTVDENGVVKTASAWLILYQLKQFEPNMAEWSRTFEKEVGRSIDERRAPERLLDLYYFHSATFDLELEKENRRITPKFSITFTALIIFSILTTFTFKWVTFPASEKNTRTWPIVDWVLSKPLIGICGVVITLMAIISSTGLLLLLDVTFVDMCTVMPFLSLTIGIDDTFLMLAAWHETPRSDSVEKRIEASMRHAAVSISITSLTDALAFLIGAIAPLPAVMYFCYYSSAAIVFIFVYCLTIFVAVLSLQGRRENECLNSVTGSTTVDFNEFGNASGAELLLNMGSQLEKPFRVQNNNDYTAYSKETQDHRMWYQQFFEDVYAPFVATPICRFAALALYVAYVIFAYRGSKNLLIGFDLINIVQESSVSRKFLLTRQQLFPEDTKVMDIAVMKPPRMFDPVERQQFLDLVQDFENTWCSAGRNSTQFWYFTFEKYVADLGFGNDFNKIANNETKFNKNLRSFLMTNERFAYDVQTRNNSPTAFRLSTRLRRVDDDESMSRCAATMRSLSSFHAVFQVSTYSPIWHIADEYDIMWPQTLQDIYISIAVMIPVALLFIPQPLCSLVIGANIASIAFGVIGFMSLLGVSLDATSMITVAMSVGFSVDFAAHVSYAYMTENRSPKEGECPTVARFRYTLGTVAWPVTQASISVILGVSSLYFVDSYVVQTCFRTVLLVISFGTIHALVFLPLLLLHCHKLYTYFKK